MERGYRNSVRKAVVMTGMVAAVSAAATLYYMITGNRWQNIWVYSLFLMVLSGVGFYAETVFAGRNLTPLILFSRTRKSSLRGMQLMLLLWLVLTVLLQFIFAKMVGMQDTARKIMILYTPVIELVFATAGYAIAAVECRSRQVYTALNTVMFIVIGAGCGIFIGMAGGKVTMFADRLEELAGMTDAAVYLTVIAVCVMLYAAAAGIYKRAFYRMDVRC